MAECPTFKVGLCFDNAFALLMQRDPDVFYCEGWASLPSYPRVFHAWCCDADGVILDPTWPVSKAANASYFGVVFETRAIAGARIETGMAGFIPSGRRLHHGVLRPHPNAPRATPLNEEPMFRIVA